jgi:hypothetical protein
MYAYIYIYIYIYIVGIATGYRLLGQGMIPVKVTRVLYFSALRPVLGPTEPPVQRVPVEFSRKGGRDIRGVKLTIHLHHSKGIRYDLIEVSFQNLPGGTEDNYVNPQSV